MQMECKNQSSLECTLYNRNFVFALLLYFSWFFMFLVTIEYVYHLKKIQSLSLCLNAGIIQGSDIRLMRINFAMIAFRSAKICDKPHRRNTKLSFYAYKIKTLRIIGASILILDKSLTFGNGV